MAGNIGHLDREQVVSVDAALLPAMALDEIVQDAHDGHARCAPPAANQYLQLLVLYADSEWRECSFSQTPVGIMQHRLHDRLARPSDECTVHNQPLAADA